MGIGCRTNGVDSHVVGALPEADIRDKVIRIFRRCCDTPMFSNAAGLCRDKGTKVPPSFFPRNINFALILSGFLCA
jgi:hypothetical protein